MKAVVIGGGIGGMSVAAFLQQSGIQTVVCEKQPTVSEKGHAFLMHTEALSLLHTLRGAKADMPGERIDRFLLQSPLGDEISHSILDSWICMKRSELIRFLGAVLAPETVKPDRKFSHFIRRDDRIVAAAFFNGDIEYGDIFIGADGAHSKVRDAIFGKIPFSPVTVKEVVGFAADNRLADRYAHIFLKFQDQQQGKSFGMIPAGNNEFVWFIQYDPRISDIKEYSPELIRDFCLDMTEGYPEEVGRLLQANDFSRSYIWKTTDFDLLPSFHRDNVVLLGDAAHLALPFTSAGTSNAIIGAKTLTDALRKDSGYSEAFETYYRYRAPEVSGHIGLGRQLKKMFLSPQDYHQSSAPLPLIGDQHIVGTGTISKPGPIATNSRNLTRNPGLRYGTPLRLEYFTDPICSTCWIIQPALKKMILEYGDYLDIHYYMGGLLPSWKECRGKIQSPFDASQHWNEAARLHRIPLDGDIWLEDPLSSSFPPSIAFKAAELQDKNKALLFLRRIREMLFTEKKNIMKWKFLEMAAGEIGLDIDRFRASYGYDARIAFQRDLAFAASRNVSDFPTLVFSNSMGRSITLKGYQYPFDLEQAILELLPSAKRRFIDQTPESLFRQFPTLLEEEFAVLSGLMHDDARGVLLELYQKGLIDKVESKNGIIWKTKI